MDSERLWISWEIHRRNRSLSARVGAELVEITAGGGRFVRYFRSIRKTISILRLRKPSIVFVQNPSIVLATLVILYSRFAPVTTIIDAHNAGLCPAEGESFFRQRLADWLMRHGHLTIVTNQSLADLVTRKGGTAMVIPDPLPSFPDAVDRLELRGRKNALFICTWASDEPYVECLMAAAHLPDDVVLYVTGSGGDRAKKIDSIPSNVELTGFVPEEEFIRLLHSVDVAIDLTERENCLVCGAYEAMSATVPMVLSDKDALRSYFRCAALYCEHNPESIADSIMHAINSADSQRAAIVAHRATLERDWTETLAGLQKKLLELTDVGQRKLGQRPA